MSSRTEEKAASGAGAPVLASRIQGSGEMAANIREFPWKNTSLGPIDEWSPELLGSVNLMLASRQTTCLIWGQSEQVLLYNDLYVPLLGNKEQSLGHNFLDVWSELKDQAGAIIAEPFRTRESNLFERVPFFILIDGKMEERICTLTNSPVWSLSGEEPRILGLFQTIVDHTEGELAIRELREEKETLGQIMAASRDAITLVNREWRITYLNSTTQQIVGPENELIGKDLWESFPDIAREDSPCRYYFRRAMEEGIPASFETSYPEPYNLPIAVDVSPTTGGIVTFVRDITLEKKAEAALLQNEKLAAVGRLASSIAHEINNPLESVTNLLYLAKANAEPGPVHEYLETAERELRRVSVISNQTLRFNKQSTKPTVTTCSDLFSEALSMYQGRLINSHIQVEKRKRAERPAQCFEGEIRQVLSNFISNAIDSMHGSGGRLILRSREATNWKTGEKGLSLTVADTGSGIAPEKQQKIFEAFYTTKGIGGTGLGLWISREIVDRHKGAIRFRSSQRVAQHGTVFNLFLPFEAATRD